MIDREKVIKGMVCCADGHLCHECFYQIVKHNSTDDGIVECTSALAHDALALLKEQEAVEPILIREARNKNYNDYVCPRCDNEVVYEQNYCSECGVRFLWEGR